MKKNLLKFVLIASLLLNISMLISAGYTYYKRSHYPPTSCGPGLQPTGLRGPGHLFEELSLKPEQLTTMQRKAGAFHAALDGKRREIEQKRISLIALMRKESPDTKSIDATIAEINRLQQDVQTLAATHMLEFKGMLNIDQQAKFFDLIEEAMRGGAGLQCP